MAFKHKHLPYILSKPQGKKYGPKKQITFFFFADTCNMMHQKSKRQWYKMNEKMASVKINI